MKSREAIWALGAMSGTSLDGVDAAMLRTDGVDILEFGEARYRPYSDAERDVLRAALGQWPGDKDVEAASEGVETAHAALLTGFSGAELVGFHGQTLAHDPGGRGTHQAGDGAVLADILNIPVAWDFRTADVAMGGQGAPLAPYFHFACAKFIDLDAPVAFLNLGGVGNITYVDPRAEGPTAQEALLAFDTGPANAPLNDLMQSRLGKPLDKDGALAAKGRVDDECVATFLKSPYFYKIPPKSLDRNDFPDLLTSLSHLSDADAAATLVACIAASVVQGMLQLPDAVSQLLVTGGGRKNPSIMAALAQALTIPVLPVEEVGLDGDMLEAQAFAYLAVRVLRGLPTSGPTTTGVKAHIGGGVISRPGNEGGAQRGISKLGAASVKPSN